jgi:hypothetical protein
MSNLQSTNGESEYHTTTTVTRNKDEAFAVDAWTISGTAVDATRAYTYGRTEGLYKLSPENTPKVVDAFDDVFDSLQAKYAGIDEQRFERLPGDAYELLITVIDAADARPYDSTFARSNMSVHVLSDTDGDELKTIDAAIKRIDDCVTTDD